MPIEWVNAVIELMNRWGEAHLVFAVAMFVQFGILGAVLWVIDLLLRRRARAIFRYWLWTLVLVKLMLPVGTCTPTSAAYWLAQLQPGAGDSFSSYAVSWGSVPVLGRQPSRPDAESPTAESGLPAPVEPSTRSKVVAPSGAIRLGDTIPPGEKGKVHASKVRATVAPLTRAGALWVGWLTVFCSFLLLCLRRMVSVYRLVHDACDAGDDLQRMLDECATAVGGVRCRISLRSSDAIGSPAVCGLFRPTILLPTRLPNRLTAEQLRTVFLHELAHIKRGDLPMSHLQTVLQLVYFYNPLVWIANAVIRRLREQAVDEMVLVSLGPRATTYGTTLVDIAALAFRPTRLSLRLLGVVESRVALAQRIQHIVHRPLPKSARLKPAGLATIVLLGMTVLPMAGPGPAQDAAAAIPSQISVEDPKATERATEPTQTAQDLAGLISRAKPGDVVTLPQGVYKTPITIDKALTLNGEDADQCVLELTADQPAIQIATDDPVVIDKITIKWQLATSEKRAGPDCAVAVKDGNVTIRNCRVIALGNFKRCPSAVQCLGFSNVKLEKCWFEGFEYTIGYSGGAEGSVVECVILNPGHCGASVYSGSRLEVAKTIITGSGYHGLRCTGGTLLAHDNLIIKNKNRGIYLGNKSASGKVNNNVILGNGTAIGAFAQTDVSIENNLLLESTYAGVGTRDSCPLTVKNNVFQDNARGVIIFTESGRRQVTLGQNSFWKNEVDTENIDMPPESIVAAPRFKAPERGDFTTQAAELKSNHQGLTDAGVFEDLWKQWSAISAAN